MPKVPVYNQPQVEERALPDVRSTPNAPIESFGGGRGLDQATQAVRGLAGLGMDIYQREKNKADEINIKDADLDSAQSLNTIEAEMRNMRGKDAAGAPDFANKAWEKEAERISVGLKNDVQRAAAQRILRARKIQLDETANIHMASELKQYGDQQHKSLQEVYRNDGSVNYNRDGYVGRSIFQQEQEIDRYADANPELPTAWRESEKAKAKSATYRAVLERMEIDGDAATIPYGNTKLTGKQFSDLVEPYLTEDDVKILDKFRKEARLSKEAALEQYERDIYLKLIDSTDPIDKKLEFLDGELRSDRMKLSTLNKMRGYVLDINDDPTIPADEKLSHYHKILSMVDDLEGVKVSKKTGKIKSMAKGNTIEELRPVMDEILASSKYLTKEQQRKFMSTIQDNMDDPSIGFFKSLVNIFKKTPPVTPAKQMEIIDKGMDVLSEKIPTDQKALKFQQLKDEVSTVANPNKSKYPIGTIKKASNGYFYEVDRYLENGNPHWSLKKKK